MASMTKIERMREYLEDRGHETEPKWIRGYEDRKMHLSGDLREAVMNWSDLPPEVEALLYEAAETLDDAHEEWLEAQAPEAFKGWNP